MINAILAKNFINGGSGLLMIHIKLNVEYASDVVKDKIGLLSYYQTSP